MTSANSETKKIGDNQIVNWRKRLDTKSVSDLADSMADEYSNHSYRKWYCWLIYELGPARITEMRGRARDANNPGKLFSKLANEEVASKKAQEHKHA